MTASPLAAAVVGVADLDRSLAFYRGHLGLTVFEQGTWAGRDLERHWHLPPDAAADMAVLGFPGSDVGRVVLLRFGGDRRELIRTGAQRRFYGLFNLNFYCHDIDRAADHAQRSGYPLWTRPIRHELQPATGQPTEVLYEGPDGVPINLVELPAGEGTRVGEMRRYLDRHGTTPTGFTEVTTSSHCIRDHAAALAFHRDVLGQEPIIDERIDKPESNRLLGLDPGAVTRITFLRGGHDFGKVVLSSPVNYRPADLVPRAVAPNIGYLAMTFEVDDLDAAVTATGRPPYTPRHELTLPGFGPRAAALVHAPGSGALYQLVAR